MKQENKEKIAQAEEILERLKEQRGGNVLSIHKKMANDPKLLQAFSQPVSYTHLTLPTTERV